MLNVDFVTLLSYRRAFFVGTVSALVNVFYRIENHFVNLPHHLYLNGLLQAYTVFNFIRLALYRLLADLDLVGLYVGLEQVRLGRLLTGHRLVPFDSRGLDSAP